MTEGSRVVIEMRDGHLQFMVEKTSVKDLISILGFYTGFVVTKAVDCGADEEDIKRTALEVVLESVTSMKDIGKI